jgi:hypothetical protein
MRIEPVPPRWAWTGARVQSIDGKRIGRVDAVEGDYLKIHRALGRDFWLPDVLVRGADGDDLVLHVERPTLRRYQLR